MVRLTRLIVLLGSVIGFSAAAPNTSHAGVIPWIYDAIFGPVGSMRYGYGTYGAGYAGYGYGGYGSAYSGYAPTTAYYAPTTAYSYGGGSCSSCNSCNSTNYGTTSYGSYGGSSSCSNCTVGGSYGGTSQTNYPAPDPNSISRDVEYRLERVEHDLKEIHKFLKDKHVDYGPDPYSGKNSTYRPGNFGGNGDPRSIDTVRQRRQNKESFPSESDPEAPKFKEPFKRDEQEGRKPELPINPPSTGDEDKKVTEEKPDNSQQLDKAQQKETEPQSMRLDRRITTRAVAPKERLASGVGSQPKAAVASQPKAAVVKTARKPSKTWLDSSNASEVARH